MDLTSNTERESEMEAKTTGNDLGRLKAVAASFHRDENGLKVVEMLLIIFVAALILIGFMKVFFPHVMDQVKAKVDKLLEME
jgi:Flp pilus assembly pilin Flp